MTRPEHELLLLCARPSLDRQAQARIGGLLRQTLDWDYLGERAVESCVASLLYWRLNSTHPALVPERHLGELRERFQITLRRNLFLAGELVKICGMFEADRLPAIPYKGPALTFRYYDNPGVREFGDLDVLIGPGDANRAQELLQSAGFQSVMFESCPQEAVALPFARAFHYELSFASADRTTSIDLHWAVMPGFFFFPAGVEHFRERLEPVAIGGRQVLTLSPEDLLLVLCVHGAKHIWERLIWLSDVARVIERSPDLDWDYLARQAARFRTERALYLGLSLAQGLLGVDLPAAVLRRIASDRKIASLRPKMTAQLFQQTRLTSSMLASCIFYLQVRERLRDGLRSSLELALRPTLAEWAALPLPRALFGLYYVLRPIRLIGKHGLGKLKRAVSLTAPAARRG